MSEQGHEVAQPLRVEPLEYSAPVYRRPGLVSAMGVMSIIVAAATMLGNIILALMSLGFMLQPTMRAQLAAAQAATAQQQAQIQAQARAQAAGETGPRGYASQTRGVVVAAFGQIQALSRPRTRQLDRLLAAAGQDMFPFDESQITRQRVRASVAQSGRHPSASGGDDGADYYILGNGRVELVDRQASFVPSDGRPTVRVSANGPVEPNDDATAAAPIAAAAVPATPVAIPVQSIAPAVMTMIESLLSIGLAVYLLVIGVIVLRGTPSGARLHRIYAWIKLPMAIVATALWAWLFVQFTGTGGNSVAVGIFGAMIGIAGALYPIALLLVLRSSEVKDYFNAASPPRQ